MNGSTLATPTYARSGNNANVSAEIWRFGYSETSVGVPKGLGGIWGEGLLISGSWEAMVIILGELGSKLIILGI